jgi:hypothetical protein
MAKQAVIILMVVVAFGILVPIYKGVGFLDSRILAAYACLALLFVAPASAELAAARAQSTSVSGLAAQIALIVAWGWGMTVVILATAFATLNIVSRGGPMIAPPAQFMAAVLVFSLSASIAIALLGAVLARRFSAGGVKNILRTGFLAILLVFVFGSRVLPESVTLAIFDRLSTRRALTHLAWELSVLCAAAAALLAIAVLKSVALKSRPTAPFAKIPKT